jgi:hypothetical protein
MSEEKRGMGKAIRRFPQAPFVAQATLKRMNEASFMSEPFEAPLENSGQAG